MTKPKKKVSAELKIKILADYKAGYSQNSLAREHELSPATINKICKGIPQDNIELVNNQIAINRALSELNEYEVNSINKAVNEKSKITTLFKHKALMNQAKADETLNTAITISEVDIHSRITSRNKETILGKEPTMQIQNTNTQDIKITRIIVDTNGDEIQDLTSRLGECEADQSM